MPPLLLRGAPPLPCAAFAAGGEAHLQQHVLHMQFTKAETRMAVRLALVSIAIASTAWPCAT